MKTIEEMVNKSYKGLSCKICDEKGFGVLYRVAEKTKKTDFGCYKCIIDILENSFINDSDENKNTQDLINQIRPK